LLFDLTLQFGNFLFDASFFGTFATKKVAMSIFHPLPESQQDSIRSSPPANVFAQACQAGLESASEVDVLAGLKPEGHLRFLVEEEGDDGLVVLEAPGPFSFALGIRAHAVAGHDVEDAGATAKSIDDLFVPIDASLEIATIEPNGNARGSGSELVGEGENEVLGIATRITNEIKSFGHELLRGVEVVAPAWDWRREH